MPSIELGSLLLMLLPILLVGYFYFRWTGAAAEVAWATLRMVLQLMVIGFVLTYLFASQAWGWGILVVSFMMIAASWIVLRSTTQKSLQHLLKILAAISLAGTLHLILVLYVVLGLDPLYQPKFVIPIAGMIYANTMNVLSLFIERFESELKTVAADKARSIAFRAAMIPQINTFMAVGLVSLPGMMTGQILSGVDPLIAVRYQIMVMAMVFGSAGLGIVIYDKLIPPKEKKGEGL
jgi:putative ABC transport system permease protein